jgi:hypothetical protein
MLRALALCVLAIAIQLGAAGAQASHDSTGTGSAGWHPYLLGTQVNVIGQDLRPMRSPYEGPNSLAARGDSKISHAYGVYGGVDAGHGVQAYLDVEMVRGKGISRVVGLAGPTNGDVLRQGTVDLGSGPYVARAFVRYTRSFSGRLRDTLNAGPDQIPGTLSSERLEITAGKFAVSDLFDINRYANSTRLQFLNWSLFQNTAWDFAADTRGYSNGVAIAWVHPVWTIRAGSFQMPKQANGNVFDSDLLRARGDQAELILTIPRTGTTGRILGYVNHARMGNYAEALAIGASLRQPPDIAANDRSGREKYGFGLNLEQPLTDEGETGVFARFGWNDGKNESFAFTEVDRHLSAGAQISGVHWGRANDRIGLAGVREGIVPVHRTYLAAGGVGFLLGDGRLAYGPEQILEGYYRLQTGRYLQLSSDLQSIRNPGYNRDRGPALVGSLRANFRY